MVPRAHRVAKSLLRGVSELRDGYVGTGGRGQHLARRACTQAVSARLRMAWTHSSCVIVFMARRGTVRLVDVLASGGSARVAGVMSPSACSLAHQV